jgi:phthiocerol/phenolphthiocerol synthesis type-I polyketide synthase E
MNPQHRVLHECIWEALEDAGCNPDTAKGLIGLYFGGGEDLSWRVHSMLENRNCSIDEFTLNQLNNKDYLASLISYKLNLKGPAIAVNTACSTSLVALHLAYKSLLLGESYISLAGGVSIITQEQKGYNYKEGLVNSKDGRCRAFDKDASGTIPGEGVGIIVLKRLKNAIEDGDQIYAIIKGSAINNDGNRKVGYTAPSIEGQAQCIKMAQSFAKINANSISYIETHGTGTRLGDLIEIEALNKVFGKIVNHKCAIGSVKTNIGHLDTAAGIAGVIKVALSLKYKALIASLNFKEPSPEIDFNGGPFYVNTKLQDWENLKDTPLRAGVSSFGIGGTNAHVILEEAPEILDSSEIREYRTLNISAKSAESLLRYTVKLKNYLVNDSKINLADMSFTLQVGRRHFNYRKAIVYKSKQELINKLTDIKSEDQITRSKEKDNLIVFMFSGQGSQYLNMGKDLYYKEPVFHNSMERGFNQLLEMTGIDFRSILYSEDSSLNKINQTRYTQPIIFLFEYSLSELLISFGIKPTFMIGHSIGEYVSACISGVFSFEDALRIVVKRGELMNKVAYGTMLSVLISEGRVAEYLLNGISLAAVNGPEQVVLSGDLSSIELLIKKLEQSGIIYIKLNNSHAFHSQMQDSILEEFGNELKKIKFRKPNKQFISNVSGDFISETTAVTVEYWIRQMRETVRFSDGIKNILSQNKELIFIEVGAGHSLTSIVKQHSLASSHRLTSVSLIRSIKEEASDLAYFYDKLGQLWMYGVEIDWAEYYKNESRRKISLPTYSFEPIKYPTEINLFKKGILNYDFEIDDSHAEKTREQVVVKSNYKPNSLSNFTPPHTETEKRITSILEEFFGIADIGINDNFFELGGDSLKAMVLLKRIERDFGIKIHLVDFFKLDNAKQISEYIDDRIWIGTKSEKKYNSII